ncbi:MAG: DNA repair exonuclease [Chloroflexi bacterium]|nr:DNA repair exonuclease [Chloroflexota bacterium]
MADFEPNAKRRPLRLLHMSDLHISSDIYADEAFRGFEAALQLGVEKGADVALIAGDLFDNGRVKQKLMDQVWSMLADVERPVIVLPGNHDTVLIDGVRLGKTPPNVTVIQEPDGETVFLKEYGLSVWGKPVYDHHPGFRPMAGVPPRSDDNWYVGMAHGLYMDPPDPLRASPISPEEIRQAPCDYVALGHVHVFRDVSQNGVPAYYSGAPSGSQTKTVAIVDLDPASGVSVSPLQIDLE